VRAAVLQGRKDLGAEQLVEALGRRGEAFQVLIVEGTPVGAVEHTVVGVVEADVDGLGHAAAGELLPAEEDVVPVEVPLDGYGPAVACAVGDLGADEGRGVLLERSLDGARVAAMIQLAGDLTQVADTDETW
jgi:hypothetical protein